MCEKKYIQQLEQYREDMIKDLQTLVRIKSVDELGINGDPVPFSEGVQEVFQATLAMGEREGFETFNANNYGGHIEWKVDDAAETMAILGHLDVVPEGSDWDFDPYGAEVKDGRMYGRGTSDNKGPIVASLYAMKAIKEAGFVPRKNIRVILGLDEETNWDGMGKYLEMAGKPDFGFTPDGVFPLLHSEMGVLVFDLVGKFSKTPGGAKGLEVRNIQGGTASNSVPDFAKALVYSEEGYDEVRAKAEAFNANEEHKIECKGKGKSLEISVQGVSAHGARPHMGFSAISQLMKFLGELTFANDSVAEFVAFYNEHIGFGNKGYGMGCGLTDEVSGELIWNTGVIDANEESWKLTINVRYPVTCTDDQVYDGMMEVLNKYGYGVIKKSHDGPIYLPVDHPVIVALMEAYKEFSGDVDAKPGVTGGATYARTIPNAVSFGILFPDEKNIMHHRNESISLEHWFKATKILTESIVRLTDAYQPE